MPFEQLSRIERKLDEIKQSETKTIIISVATATLVSLLATDYQPMELFAKLGKNSLTTLLDLGLTVLILSAAAYGIILLIIWLGKKITELFSNN